MKARFFVSLAATVLLAVLSACSLPKYVELYNNSSKTIAVEENLGKEHVLQEVAPNQMARIGPEIVDGAEFIIVEGGVKSTYKAKYPGSGYWTYIGLGPFKKIVVRLQYESDGRIFVLPRNSKPPIPTGIAQPHGYPLIRV